MLVYAPGWSLPSHFWSYTPPLTKKVRFSAAKKMKFPSENGIAHAHFWKKISETQKNFFFFSFGCFSETLSRRSRLSRTTSDRAQQNEKKSGQNCVFHSCVFPAKILARFCHAVLDFREHQGLPPDLVDHARSIAMPDQNGRWWPSRFLAHSFFEHRQKKVLQKVRHLVVIYTQKKPIAGFSWPGGHFSRDKYWPKKWKARLGEASL